MIWSDISGATADPRPLRSAPGETLAYLRRGGGVKRATAVRPSVGRSRVTEGRPRPTAIRVAYRCRSAHQRRSVGASV